MSGSDFSFEAQLNKQRQTAGERNKQVKDAILDLLKTKKPKEITYKILAEKLGIDPKKIPATLRSAFHLSANLQEIIEGILEHREEEK